MKRRFESKEKRPADQLTELINLKSINFPITLSVMDLIEKKKNTLLLQPLKTILDYYMPDHCSVI